MIIAEIGSVHDGSFGNAKKLIEIAKDSGADFVKFQMHIADAETSRDAYNPSYFKDESRFEYFERTSFNVSQWKSLFNFAKLNKIGFMCSVFSEKALKILIKLGIKNIKIPSGEANNLPLLEKISKEKKIRVFLSTGMSSWDEITKAVKILNRNNLIIMQCTSMYPCPNNYIGLNVIKEMKKKFGEKYSYGFSDHSEGVEAAIGAIIYGADYIEKHITFSKMMYGSDAKFAMEPEEFSKFCNSLKKIKKIISSPINKNNLRPFKKMKSVFEKNIISKVKIKKGQKIKLSHIDFKKSKKGIKAYNYKKILGLIAKKNISKGSVLKKRDL
jgi:N,N'-diacetyllegionaminate synthase